MEKTYEYEILVDGKVVWRGRKLQTKFNEIKRKNPKSEIGISWAWGDDIYIL